MARSQSVWSSDVLRGLPFTFKLKSPKVNYAGDLLSRVQHLQISSQLHQPSCPFTLEETCLVKYQEPQKPPPASRSLSPPTLPVVRPTCDGSVLEPLPASTKLAKEDRSSHAKLHFIEEFEQRQDDPFESAELNTLNDLEELRQVLLSSDTLKAEENGADKTPPQVSLHDITFPQMEIAERQTSNSSWHTLSSRHVNAAALYASALQKGFRSEHVATLLNVYASLYNMAEVCCSSLKLPPSPLSREQFTADLVILQNHIDPSASVEDQAFAVILCTHASKSSVRSCTPASIRHRFHEHFRLLKSASPDAADCFLKSCLILAELENSQAQHLLRQCSRQ